MTDNAITENLVALDARGLSCPLPILKAKKAINRMQAGDILEITATDPGSVSDLDAFCRETGNEMLASQQAGGEFLFRIRKAA